MHKPWLPHFRLGFCTGEDVMKALVSASMEWQPAPFSAGRLGYGAICGATENPIEKQSPGPPDPRGEKTVELSVKKTYPEATTL